MVGPFVPPLSLSGGGLLSRSRRLVGDADCFGDNLPVGLVLRYHEKRG